MRQNMAKSMPSIARLGPCRIAVATRAVVAPSQQTAQATAAASRPSIPYCACPYQATPIKVVASAEASELALRLASGRSRMNDAHKLRSQGDSPGPEPVDEPAAL